jgi:hypothetical protein
MGRLYRQGCAVGVAGANSSSSTLNVNDTICIFFIL